MKGFARSDGRRELSRDSAVPLSCSERLSAHCFGLKASDFTVLVHSHRSHRHVSQLSHYFSVLRSFTLTLLTCRLQLPLPIIACQYLANLHVEQWEQMLFSVVVSLIYDSYSKCLHKSCLVQLSTSHLSQ